MRYYSYTDEIAAAFGYPANTRNITFQVTNDCPCACTYCYQGHKGHEFMTKETAYEIIDLMFDMYDKNEPNAVINKNTVAVILEFIGGEPLMNIEVIDAACEYFIRECLRRNHPWLYFWRISLTSNGALYFKPEVQKFLEKFRYFISITITLDGPQEIHDSCRVYHDGTGNFKDAYAATLDIRNKYHLNEVTKVTLAPENLPKFDTIIDFFMDLGVEIIWANCAYEPEWTVEHAKIFYAQLKNIADKILASDKEVNFVLFDDSHCIPLGPEWNNNWCGGTGEMLAFDPAGKAYPCLRYMSSSLGDDQPPMIIGDTHGIYNTPETQETYQKLNSITRRSQSTDECWECPIAAGCAWCSAWNYQLYGTPNKRCTNICIMHKARSLASVYYFNKYYKKHNINKKFKMYLPKEEALKIIDENEYNMLLDLGGKGEE